MDTQFTTTEDRLDYAASIYAADAMLWLSLTNPNRNLELAATSVRLRIHYLFPLLDDAARAELVQLVFAATPFRCAKERSKANPEDRATRIEMEVLEAELSEKVKELMDRYGHAITDTQRTLLARMLGLTAIPF